MDQQNVRQKTVGLSFAGGGVQAWAEVAVYADLERQGIEVDAVAGTSMGSFLAAAVASGLSAEEIYQIIRDTDQAIDKSSLFGPQAFLSLFSFRQPLGLVLIEKLAEVIRPVNKLYGEVMLSDVPKPLAIPAVDVVNNKMIVFSNQPEYFQTVFEDAEFYDQDIPLLKACLASSAYPIILSPVKIENYQLIDGGVLMNSPAALFSKEKVEHVIAIRIPLLKNTGPVEKRIEVGLRAINLMVKHQENVSSTAADQQYFLNIKLPGLFEFGDSEPIIRAGKRYVQENPIDVGELYEPIEPTISDHPEEKVKKIIEEPETTQARISKIWQQIKKLFR